MTPTAELRTELCILLGEAAPPDGRFTQTEIDYLLTKSEDVYEAAYRGWNMKSNKLIEAGGLVQSITSGSETYRFTSLADLKAWCKERADECAAESTSSVLHGRSGLIVGIEGPGIDGLSFYDENGQETLQ